MKKQIFMMIQLCFFILTFGWQSGFSQQVNISTHNTDFNTNFNGWNGTMPNGFTQSVTYVGTAIANTGGSYAVANSGFGFQPSGSVTICNVVGTFANNTGSTITSLEISYEAFRIEHRTSRTSNWTVTSPIGNVSDLNWAYNNSNSNTSPAIKTVTLTGLNISNGNTFTITFTGERSSTGSGSSPMIGLNNIKVKSILSVCDEPTNLAQNNITHNAGDFTWDADGSNNFEYVLSQSATNPTGAGTTINGTSHSETLTPSTTYYFHLRQNCGSGSFSDWVHVNFTTPAEPVTPCVIVDNILASNTTHEGSEISWDGITGDNFEYVLNENATAPTSGTATTGVTYSATGLDAETTYYFHIRRDCGNGNFSAWETISFTTLVEPCLIVENITTANTTHEGSEISWDGITGDNFEYALDENTTAPTSGTATTGVTYNATGLDAETTYYFHIRRDCGNGNFSAWETISFTTLVEPCLIVDNITASNTTHEASEISWDGVTGDNFEYALDENTTAPTSGTATTDLTYNATGLDAETTYYFHVRRDCGNGNFSAWETISFTTLVEPCLIVENITASNTTHEGSEISWDGVTGDNFEYALDENTTAPTSGTATTDVTYSATGLDAETTYYFHIRRDCGNGNYSAWETISFTTSVEPCLIVENITASNTTHEVSEISWDGVTGDNFEYALDENTTAPTSGTATTDVTYSATGMAAETTYYFHIRRDCGNGNFSAWETISFTTLVEPVTPCTIVENIIATNITHESSQITWTGVSGDNFEYALDQNTVAPVTGTATSNATYNATDLETETTYYFHIRRDCGNGNFSEWETISFSTLTVGINEVESISFSVYPNPASGILTIDLKSTEGMVTLTNVQGQLVKNIDLKNSNSIDVSDLNPGIYMIVYQLNGNSSIQRLIVK